MYREKEIYAGEKPIYAEMVLRSINPGYSLFKQVEPLTTESIDSYKPATSTFKSVHEWLKPADIKVISSGPFGLSVIADKAVYQELLETEVAYSSLKKGTYSSLKKKENESDADMQFEFTAEPKVPNEVKEYIERIYIPPQVRFHSPLDPHTLPYSPKWLPQDIASLTNADGAHKYTKGAGVKVAMVDSGLNDGHEYYTPRGYHITLHGVSPRNDMNGHGTGMAANLLAIAPECDFHLFQIDPTTANLSANAAFNEAVKFGAQVISNSWGCNYDPVVEASIVNAYSKGITVVFSIGDYGYGLKNPDFPGCLPNPVISVGGVYRKEGNKIEDYASDFALSGCHPNYPNRQCPDVCAICGPQPRGIFIVMPTQNGSVMDQRMSAGRKYPYRDETKPDDGWFVGSGTSAAAAQVAGCAALLLSVKPTLKPTSVLDCIQRTAKRIPSRNGQSAIGETPPKATGSGLIDAGAAVALVPTYP